MQLPEHISSAQWQRFKQAAEQYETPFLLLDLDVIRHKYQELEQSFDYAGIYYAVKANPSDEIVELLAELGSNFDIASTYELDKVLKFGV